MVRIILLAVVYSSVRQYRQAFPSWSVQHAAYMQTQRIRVTCDVIPAPLECSARWIGLVGRNILVEAL